MGESTLLNKYEMVSPHVVNLKIGGGPGTFFVCPGFVTRGRTAQALWNVRSRESKLLLLAEFFQLVTRQVIVSIW
jgi:hypothetical protein